MKKVIKAIIKFIWHFQSAYGMLTMPLAGVSASFTIFTFLDVRYHIALTAWQYLGFYLFVMFVGAGLGYVMKRAGLFQYLTSLGNEQNEELMKIDEILKKLNEK